MPQVCRRLLGTTTFRLSNTSRRASARPWIDEAKQGFPRLASSWRMSAVRCRGTSAQNDFRLAGSASGESRAPARRSGDALLTEVVDHESLGVHRKEVSAGVRHGVGEQFGFVGVH